MSVFLGLRSPLPDAVKNTVGDNVRAVAIDGDGGIFHEDTRLARVAHRDLGRGRLDLREGGVETFEDGGTQGARSDIDQAAPGIGAGVRDLRSGSCVVDLRDVVVIKAASKSNGRGRRAQM